MAEVSSSTSYEALPPQRSSGLPQVPPALQRSSSQLLRTVTASLSGGAAVLPTMHPAQEEVSQATTAERTQRRTAAHAHMQQEVMRRFQRIFFIGMMVLVVSLLTMSIVIYNAVYAWLIHSSDPCDQPMNLYLIVFLVVSQLSLQLSTKCGHQRVSQHRWKILMSIPGWIVIAWGAYMIHSCQTCQKTNPDLYYSTATFIYTQAVASVCWTLVYSWGAPRMLLFIHSLNDSTKPGCEAAVHALPKVPEGSPELMDTEDGKVMECPICQEAFTGQRVVVRTGCSHHFHEACLAKWCKNHMECPMCRKEIGDMDDA